MRWTRSTPITEEVTGVDLVRQQILIAAGERLAFSQDDLQQRGQAIECRIYAEDPLRGFAPSPGVITLLERPDGPGIRVDSGVRVGSAVPLDYDPMLGKLVVWAEDRPRAVARLRRALEEYRITGISTTLPLFRLLVDLPEFQQGRLHTRLLDELLSAGSVEALEASGDPEVERVALVAAACLAAQSAEQLPAADLTAAELEGSAWRREGRRMIQGRYPR